MSISDTGFIHYKNSDIHYIRFGSGEEILFAFHGFSENAESFLVLEPSLGTKFTIIAIDLPYHGNSNWNEPGFFTTQDLIDMVALFIDRFHVERFSILGFSMGGKCALFMIKSFAERIDILFLLASDGIKTNKMYNVAVYPKWGRKLFKTTIHNPKWFFIFIQICKTLKIISPWLYKFTTNHMDTKEKRQRLYETWISMGSFNPDIPLVKERINKYGIRSILFFGLRDEVIPITVSENFASGLLNCQLIKLERGHYFIDEKLNPFINLALSNKPDNH